MPDAFAAALERWPADGVPTNPRAWLISAGRFKAIDLLRSTKREVREVVEVGEEPARRLLERRLREISV